MLKECRGSSSKQFVDAVDEDATDLLHQSCDAMEKAMSQWENKRHCHSHNVPPSTINLSDSNNELSPSRKAKMKVGRHRKYTPNSSNFELMRIPLKLPIGRPSKQPIDHHED